MSEPTDEEIERLAAEAERGYPLESLKPRPIAYPAPILTSDVALRFKYEVQHFGRRGWNWRRTFWRAGHYYAKDYASEAEALAAVEDEMARALHITVWELHEHLRDVLTAEGTQP